MSDYERMRARADSLIRRRGQAAILRRSTGDRECWALEAVLNANDRQALKNPTDRVFLVSPVGLDVAPDYNEDALVWLDKTSGIEKVFRMSAPVSPLQPGDTVIYYELQVQG